MPGEHIEVKTSAITHIPVTTAVPPQPCIMVIFGVSGDLAHRKIIPALYDLYRDDHLPTNFAIIGFSRSDKPPEQFREEFRQSVGKHSRYKSIHEEKWRGFMAILNFIQGDINEQDCIDRLKNALNERDKSRGTRGNRIFYFATPSRAFPDIINKLSESGLLYPQREEKAEPWIRAVIEKPFGKNRDTARELNHLAAKSLDESQIYRMDHYLGKETVQNIMVFRFGNSIFEPLWNCKHIDHVEITAAEDIGIEGRGHFYEQTGILRDIVQNHLLQILALCTMEPPISFDADAIRDEKAKIFRALRPLEGETMDENIVLGQYKGYREETNVAPDSKVPTYAALKTYVDNWRWKGVPFFLRTGKKLKKRLTDVSIHFQQIPFCLFGQENVCRSMGSNVLTLRIQPDEGISLSFVSKIPEHEFSIGNVTMDFSYARSFGKSPHEAYERLLLDCMRGDQTLFARRDEAELQWGFLEPALEFCMAKNEPDLHIYEPGSAGPEAADWLIEKTGRKWNHIL